MKNWSTTKKIVVLLVVIAIVLIAWNWNAVSKQLGISKSEGAVSESGEKKVVVKTSPFGKCTKHASSAGGTWYTYGGIEVSAADCQGTL